MKHLKQIEERAKAASEGTITVLDSGWAYEDGATLKHLSCMAREGALNPEDAQLFAHAREDVLTLVSEVRRLKKLIKEK